MKLLAIGDVFGAAGRRALEKWLREVREETAADFVVVNVENLHHGKGVDPPGARAVLDLGADCLTSGNHVWAGKNHDKLLEVEPRLIRPANYPAPCPGRGVFLGEARGGARVCVFNLVGRVFMAPVDDPFRVADEIVRELNGHADVVALDIHAEATSEKLALALHLDGRVAAVFGTHTHVQTADARVLPRGAGFISDLGMTGPYESVIGLEADGVVRRFATARPLQVAPADGGLGLRGALFDIDETTGRCRSVVRIVRGAGGQ